MKKAWNMPKFNEINISETCYGGMTPLVHDGPVYEDKNGNPCEGYCPISGERAKEQ